MVEIEPTRREVLKAGAAGAAALTVLQIAGPAAASSSARAVPEGVVPWLDQPPPVPEPAQGIVPRQLRWELFDSRVTRNAEFFVVQHYGVPQLSASSWRLRVDGRVSRPLELSLAALQAQPRRTIQYTMECSGNHGLPFFTGGVGNARWTARSCGGSCALRGRCPARTRWCSGAPTVVRWQPPRRARSGVRRTDRSGGGVDRRRPVPSCPTGSSARAGNRAQLDVVGLRLGHPAGR